VKSIRAKDYEFEDVSRKLREYIPARQKGRRIQQKLGAEDDSVVLAVNTRKMIKYVDIARTSKGGPDGGNDESECFTKKREEKNADKEISKAETNNELIAKIEEVSNMETAGPGWQYDSVATVHTTNQKERLINPEISNTWVKGHDGTRKNAELIGEIQIQTAGQNYLISFNVRQP
jgi:hypothetical protein